MFPLTLSLSAALFVEVASTRFVRQVDFCSFAVRIASQNISSISASSPPTFVRNTPRETIQFRNRASASDTLTHRLRLLIVSRASQYDPQGAKLLPLVQGQA